jgi:hypothetical protein
MRQQINLYQPIFRQQRRPFAAATALGTLGLVVVALLAIWGYGLVRVTHLGQDLVRLRSLQQQQLQIAASAGAARLGQPSPVALQAQASQLLADLKQRQQALEILRSGAAGDAGGFARRLGALAHRHIDGLWLDHIVLVGGAGVASLSGRTLDPDLVPVYLQALTAESALAGTRFEAFGIESVPALTSDIDASGVADPAATKPPKKQPAVLRFHAETAAAPTLQAKSSS